MSQNGALSNASFSGRKRAPAQKVLISEIGHGENVRINVMAVVIGKDGRLFIDDGSDRVAVSGLNGIGDCLALKVGDIVTVIGKANGVGQQRQILAETIKKIQNPVWMKVRQHELGQEKKRVVDVGGAVEVKREDSFNMLDYIMGFIRSMDKGGGVLVDEIIEKSPTGKAREVVLALIQNGDVFEVEPGKIKILE